MDLIIRIYHGLRSVVQQLTLKSVGCTWNFRQCLSRMNYGPPKGATKTRNWYIYTKHIYKLNRNPKLPAAAKTTYFHGAFQVELLPERPESLSALSREEVNLHVLGTRDAGICHKPFPPGWSPWIWWKLRDSLVPEVPEVRNHGDACLGSQTMARHSISRLSLSHFFQGQSSSLPYIWTKPQITVGVYNSSPHGQTMTNAAWATPRLRRTKKTN